MIRIFALVMLAAGLGACAKADNLHRQIVWTGGTGYDVRSISQSPTVGVYDASAAYTKAKEPERAQITRNLLYRGLDRVKSGGFEYVLIQGPGQGKLTETITRYGAVVSQTDYPSVQFKLTGYKGDAVRPPQAVEVEPLMARLKPQVNDL